MKWYLFLFFLTGISCKRVIDEPDKVPMEKELPAAVQKGSINENETFICEFPVDAAFPGGQEAWVQFLQTNIVIPEMTADECVSGQVILAFQVCEDGALCNVEAISGPEFLRAIALTGFKKSPRWVPATMQGKPVKSYKRQPIIFRFVEEEPADSSSH